MLDSWSAAVQVLVADGSQAPSSVPGAICHIMNRGDRREPIFADDVSTAAVAVQTMTGDFFVTMAVFSALVQ